jgi:hypothetical protein
MIKEKTDVKKLIKKIGIGVIIGLFVFLFVSYLYSPVHTKINKTVEGEYRRYETEEHGAETDKVKISINGELQREHRFSKKDVTFVGNVVVEFENYPDRNFELIGNSLLFSGDDDGSFYYYGLGYQDEMYNCVYSIYVKMDKEGDHIIMNLNEDWGKLGELDICRGR